MWHGRFDRLFIGGRWALSHGSERMPVVSPFTEDVIAEVPSATTEDVDDAVAAARAAFDDGPWPRAALETRMGTVGKLGRLIAGNQELIAQVVPWNGSPVGLHAPFGGFKTCGIGRENGPEGLDPYTELRSIGVPDDLAATLADR